MTPIRPCLFAGPAPRRTLTDAEWAPIREAIETAHYAACRARHERRLGLPVREATVVADVSRDGSTWTVEIREDTTLHAMADGRWLVTATQSSAPTGAEIAHEGLNTLTRARREAERLALVVGGCIRDGALVLDLPDRRLTDPATGWWSGNRVPASGT